VKKPKLRDYWSTSNFISSQFSGSLMSKKWVHCDAVKYACQWQCNVHSQKWNWPWLCAQNQTLLAPSADSFPSIIFPLWESYHRCRCMWILGKSNLIIWILYVSTTVFIGVFWHLMLMCACFFIVLVMFGMLCYVPVQNGSEEIHTLLDPAL
jgi:hypothetical protein